MGKLRVGIEINEILRLRWLKFDQCYVNEFGEDSVPEDQKYVFDFFKEYKWEDTTETIKELKEPEDINDDINPKYYQVDENGEAEADYLLFKKDETVNLTAKEVYNRFMYQDYLFEIFGASSVMYRNMDVDVMEFIQKYDNTIDLSLFSVENKLSIPPTLFFLSKMNCRFKTINFIDDESDAWKNIDILITTNPTILNGDVPDGKTLIKLNRPYNVDIKSGVIGNDNLLQIKDLIESEDFQKIIGYVNNNENE